MPVAVAPPAVAPPATTLVSDWGRCPACDAISYRGATCCASAWDQPLRQELVEEAVDQVEIPARWVKAIRASDTTDYGSDVLPLKVSDSAGRNEWAHAEAVAMKFSLRVAEFGQDALRSTTLTGPQVSEQMKIHGAEVDRKTAYNHNQDLVATGQLARVGQLPDQAGLDADGMEIMKKGAILYAVASVRRTLGDLRDGWSVFGRWLLPHTDFLTRGIRRARGYLKWALEQVMEGNRHAHMYRLACRCREWGLAFTEAEELMREFQNNVPQAGLKRSWMNDGTRALEHAYR